MNQGRKHHDACSIYLLQTVQKNTQINLLFLFVFSFHSDPVQ